MTIQKVLRILSGNNGGFSLIEMMVAVLVVSIMVSVMIPHLLAAGERAQATASAQNQRTIRAAIEEYYLIHHSMPVGNSHDQLETLVKEKLLDALPENTAGTIYLIDDSDVNNVIVTTSNGVNSNA